MNNLEESAVTGKRNTTGEGAYNEYEN